MNLTELLRISEKECSGIYSLTPTHRAFYEVEALKLPPDFYVHRGPYCVFTKMNGNVMVCSKGKKRCMRMAARGRFFKGLCPNGVYELVQPVIFQGELVAAIHCGHFASEKTPDTVNGRPYDGPELKKLDHATELKIQQRLLFIADYIKLELELWLDRGGDRGKQRDENYYLEQATNFIARRFSHDISLDELAASLKVNPNYLGGLLRRLSGKNFRRLLNEKRIDASKVYLRLHKHMTISQIATMCGFPDSNYFSTVFKKHMGIPPRKYREQKEESGRGLHG